MVQHGRTAMPECNMFTTDASPPNTQKANDERKRMEQVALCCKENHNAQIRKIVRHLPRAVTSRRTIFETIPAVVTQEFVTQLEQMNERQARRCAVVFRTGVTNVARGEVSPEHCGRPLLQLKAVAPHAQNLPRHVRIHLRPTTQRKCALRNLKV